MAIINTVSKVSLSFLKTRNRSSILCEYLTILKSLNVLMSRVTLNILNVFSNIPMQGNIDRMSIIAIGVNGYIRNDFHFCCLHILKSAVHSLNI